MASPQNPFPPQAVSWMTGERARVLLVGGSRALVRMLVNLNHQVTCIDSSLVALNRAGADNTATCIAANTENLPFAPCQFDVVLLSQNFHLLAHRTALAEIARVLTQQGSIAVVYTTRDDTVPWVKRLASTIQTVDPTAMRGDYGAESIDSLYRSRYFPHVEEQSFRTWFPIDRNGLINMVQGRPIFSHLNKAAQDSLISEVAAHYDAMSRAPEPLLLPYQAVCWRAMVAQDELSIPITYEDGLRIF
ncbi:MAG: class I SAM-dependent methyltransferase [Propionibacteriaceae bacterium]